MPKIINIVRHCLISLLIAFIINNSSGVFAGDFLLRASIDNTERDKRFCEMFSKNLYRNFKETIDFFEKLSAASAAKDKKITAYQKTLYEIALLYKYLEDGNEAKRLAVAKNIQNSMKGKLSEEELSRLIDEIVLYIAYIERDKKDISKALATSLITMAKSAHSPKWRMTILYKTLKSWGRLPNDKYIDIEDILKVAQHFLYTYDTKNFKEILEDNSEAIEEIFKGVYLGSSFNTQITVLKDIQTRI